MAGAQAIVLQELDFLGLENHSSDRRPNFRGIQKAITKMNPEVIKSVIASSGGLSVSYPLPLFVAPLSGGCKNEEGSEETAPMTIFYNGMVTAFDLPKNQAERILKMVKGESSKINVEPQPNLFEEGLFHFPFLMFLILILNFLIIILFITIIHLNFEIIN
ncbi:hypothetical protein V2J09_001642 [Rumex salicifolius]